MPSFFDKFFRSKPKVEEEILTPENSVDLQAIVVSDLGNIRTNNEDCALFVRPNDLAMRSSKGYLGIVADGMGGHAAGEVASHLAVETIRKVYYESDDSIERSLKEAFRMANSKIHGEASKDSKRRGMGTTATTVVMLDGMLQIAHVGDSRLYSISQEGISQLSSDHTYVQEMIRKGDMIAEEAARHPDRNILTRAMGTQPQVEVEWQSMPYEWKSGNRLLLCSDGLYDYLADDEIREILMQNELRPAAYKLVEIAKERGGHDNITVLIIEAVKEDNKTAKPTRNVEDTQKETREIGLD